MQDIQFQPRDSEEVRLKKLRLLAEEVQRLSKAQSIVVEEGDGITVQKIGNRYIISVTP